MYYGFNLSRNLAGIVDINCDKMTNTAVTTTVCVVTNHGGVEV